MWNNSEQSEISRHLYIPYISSDYYRIISAVGHHSVYMAKKKKKECAYRLFCEEEEKTSFHRGVCSISEKTDKKPTKKTGNNERI
jgi:hypothetical protein